MVVDALPQRREGRRPHGCLHRLRLGRHAATKDSGSRAKGQELATIDHDSVTVVTDYMTIVTLVNPQRADPFRHGDPGQPATFTASRRMAGLTNRRRPPSCSKTPMGRFHVASSST